MQDHVYPSIFLSYFFFFLAVCVALFFCIRSVKDGYWGRDSEETKYRMLEDDEAPTTKNAEHSRR